MEKGIAGKTSMWWIRSIQVLGFVLLLAGCSNENEIRIYYSSNNDFILNNGIYENGTEISLIGKVVGPYNGKCRLILETPSDQKILDIYDFTEDHRYIEAINKSEKGKQNFKIKGVYYRDDILRQYLRDNKDTSKIVYFGNIVITGISEAQ